MRAVIYARVSTDEQAQKGLSLPAQIEHCQKYAREHGFAVVRIFQDEGESAMSSNRPAFLEAIEYCKAGPQVDALIVYDTSRFARNREDAVVFKRMLEKRGVKVHYASQIISDDPEGKFLEGMLEVIDEHYSRVLGRVSKRGMIESVKRGNWCGGPPYGYRMVLKGGRRTLEVEPREAEAVRLVFELFQNGFGCKSIAEKLNDKGFRTRFGKPIRTNTIKVIITNPAYTGTTVFNRYKRGRHTRRAERPKEEWVIRPNTHDPLVSKQVFDAVQAEMSRRANERKPGLYQSERRFSGIVRCAHCGGMACAMTGTSGSGKLHYYYTCRTRWTQSRTLCPGMNVRADALENTVLDGINTKVFSEKNINGFVEGFKRMAQEFDQGRTSEKLRIQRKLQVIQQKLRNVVLLGEDGAIDSNEAKQRTQELQRQRQELTERYAKLEDQLTFKNVIPTKALLQAAHKELQRILSEAEPRMQRSFLKRFIKSVETDGKQAKVVYNLACLCPEVFVLSSGQVGVPCQTLSPTSGRSPGTRTWTRCPTGRRSC